MAALRFIRGMSKAVLANKAKTKPQEAADFALSFPLYFEQCKAWVSKVTKATYTSILQV